MFVFTCRLSSWFFIIIIHDILVKSSNNTTSPNIWALLTYFSENEEYSIIKYKHIKLINSLTSKKSQELRNMIIKHHTTFLEFYCIKL